MFNQVTNQSDMGISSKLAGLEKIPISLGSVTLFHMKTGVTLFLENNFRKGTEQQMYENSIFPRTQQRPERPNFEKSCNVMEKSNRTSEVIANERPYVEYLPYF